MFLAVTTIGKFKDTQIILPHLVLLTKSRAQNIQTGHQGDLIRIKQTNHIYSGISKMKEKTQKSNCFWLQFMITFQNLNLKTETYSAKLVVKSISETRNVNDVSIYVCFIYSFDKNLRKRQCKKINNSKCTKFTIKN